MSGEAKRVGRPTKLTPELAAAIVAHVAAGNYGETAAAMEGVGRSAFYEWMDRGRRGESPFADFANAVTRARAKAEADAVQEVRNGFSDPKTGAERAQWFLERTAPDRFGRRDKLTVENAVSAEVDLILSRLEAALPTEWYEVALRAITGGEAGRGETGDADGDARREGGAPDPVH